VAGGLASCVTLQYPTLQITTALRRTWLDHQVLPTRLDLYFMTGRWVLYLWFATADSDVMNLFECMQVAVAFTYKVASDFI